MMAAINPRIACLAIAILLASACSAQRPTAPPAADSASVRQPVLDEMTQLRLTEMCSVAARQFWKDGGFEKRAAADEVWAFSSHYNRRLRRCLVQITFTTFGKGQATRSQAFIDDPFEGIEIASGSNINRADVKVAGDDVLSSTSSKVEHPYEWFKRLMTE